MAVTVDGQLEWRDTLLGPNTVYRTVAVAGWWDLPNQRGTNPTLPGRHGSYPGQKLSGDRMVTWEFKVKSLPLAEFPAALDVLRQITAPVENPVEEPLQLQIDSAQGPLRVMARVIRRAIPTNQHYALGYTTGAVVWEATDPRLYSVAELSTVIGLPVASPGGLDFGSSGLDFGSGGLDFGDGPQGGSGSVTNQGHVPSWPTLEITGPVTGPIVTFADTGRALSFDPAWTVLAGQTVVIDTYLRTAEIAGVSVAQRIFTRQWTPLEPGANLIRYSAAGGFTASQLTVRSRHAYH